LRSSGDSSTQFDSRDFEKASKEFDRSLKRLKMDNVDFLLVHSLEPTDDVAALEKGVKFSRTAGIAEMAQVQGSRSHIS
jgi:diketogulonate reductase-like aldo/keto reductase